MTQLSITQTILLMIANPTILRWIQNLLKKIGDVHGADDYAQISLHSENLKQPYQSAQTSVADVEDNVIVSDFNVSQLIGITDWWVAPIAQYSPELQESRDTSNVPSITTSSLIPNTGKSPNHEAQYNLQQPLLQERPDSFISGLEKPGHTVGPTRPPHTLID